MLAVTVRNVNEALPIAFMHLKHDGVPADCRANSAGAKVVRYPMPYATTYARPCERVLFDPVRDANPYFHFFEALWILAGREDVAFLDRFNGRMKDFSDNGKWFHGAYGYRLRHAFVLSNRDSHGGMRDQVQTVIDMLRADPTTRRAVLQIWDAERDLGTDTLDMPCNDLLMLDVCDGHLNMTVCCRSNDVVWGAYGANAVQFSMLLEYIAAHAGLPVGTLTQFSNNFHVYTDTPLWQAYLNTGLNLLPTHDHYNGMTQPPSLFAEPDLFDGDLRTFFDIWDDARDGGTLPLYSRDAFASYTFQTVVLPLYNSHAAYKADDLDQALRACTMCTATDWAMATEWWLSRRVEARGRLAKLEQQA